MALRIGKPTTACRWHNGWLHCATAKENAHTRKMFFSRTEALAEAIKSTEQIVEELKEVFERSVCDIICKTLLIFFYLVTLFFFVCINL